MNLDTLPEGPDASFAPDEIATPTKSELMNRLEDDLIDIMRMSNDYTEQEVKMAARTIATLYADKAPFTLVDGQMRNYMEIKGTYLSVYAPDAEHVCTLLNQAVGV